MDRWFGVSFEGYGAPVAKGVAGAFGAFFMKRNSLWLGAALPVAALVVSLPARAQEPKVTFPTEGQDVRGEINIRWEGIPDGGYAIIYIDPDTPEGKSPLTATAEGTFPLNTFLDTINKVRLGDGPHKLRVVAVNPTGRRTGQAEVGFNIANGKVAADQPGRRLVHWSNADRIANTVKRYRIYAISNATVEQPSTQGGGGGAGGAMPGGRGEGGGSGGGSGGGGGASGAGGAGGAGGADTGAALDYQISALVRRVVRDVGMWEGSANIRAVVDRAYEKTREGAQGGAGGEGGSGSGGGRSGPAAGALAPGEKPPWGEWMPARETGQYYVKMIKPTGEEINATRKAPSIALGDLLPSFPATDVRPGSTWETQMTMISELAERSPLNIRNAPMTFTAFETVTTPAGFPRQCAKLESRFQLPSAQAKEEATKLATKLGTSGGGGGEGSGGGAGGPSLKSPGSAGSAGGAAGAAAEPPEVKNARVRVSRVLWFDIKGHQVLRSEDVVDTNFETETLGGGVAGGAGGSPGSGSGGAGGPRGYPGGGGYGGAAGAAAAPAEPTKVAYNQRITTWLDDTVPPPTDQFNGGAGTAHSRDSIPDISIDRVNTPDAPFDAPDAADTPAPPAAPLSSRALSW